ncbi:MAG: TPM domain-containing protein [Ruminococcus sp.]|nr:TPM domain-containing protein [Ruminococcus sp.]
MNKISGIIVSLLTAAALCCGCSDDDEKPKAPLTSSVTDTDSSGDSASEPVTEAPTEPEKKEIERNIQPAEGTYVYDYAKILSAEDFAECNNYTEWLYETFLINAAVVTTDDLEDFTPAEYAEKAYIDLYSGRGSGFLLLINNDTNEDYLYKTGSCLASVPEETEKVEFYWATQEIVNGNYKDAILRLMQLAEYCPQHVFDNGGIFTAEQISALEIACTGGASDISILATSNGTESTNEEICRSYYDRHYKESKGFMIMLDTVTNTLTVASDNEHPAALATALTEANTLAAASDYPGALNTVIAVLKG